MFPVRDRGVWSEEINTPWGCRKMVYTTPADGSESKQFQLNFLKRSPFKENQPKYFLQIWKRFFHYYLKCWNYTKILYFKVQIVLFDWSWQFLHWVKYLRLL